MKSLIVIDFQKDFRNGTLPVPGAVEAEDAIYRLKQIKLSYGTYN